MEMHVTGRLVARDRGGGLRWYAKLRVDGQDQSPISLGRAWARDSGRRTTRGGVVWRTPDRPRDDPSHLSPVEARERLATLIEHARGGAAGRPRNDATVGDAVDAWLERAGRTCKPSTRRGYATLGRAVCRAFGRGTPIASLTHARIEEWVAGQARRTEAGELSRTTAHHQGRALRYAAAAARRQGWIEHDPTADAGLYPMPGRTTDHPVLRFAQLEAVAEAIRRASPGSVERAIHAEAVRVAAYTGLRLGELRALRCLDIDGENGWLRVRVNCPEGLDEDDVPKSAAARALPLIPEAHEALERARARNGATRPDDRVLSSPNGRRLHGARLRTSFYRGLRDAGLGHVREGLKPMTFHDLRGCYGTAMAQVFPLPELQRFMGHREVKTTARYYAMLPRPDAVERARRAITGEEAPRTPGRIPGRRRRADR